MIHIPYLASHFPGHLHAHFNGPRTLIASPSALLWATITVGRRDWPDVLQHGQYSVYESLYRSLMVAANLMLDSNNRVIHTPAFNGLDPSEKGAVSYFFGLMTGKLFGAVLGVPWIMHLKVYEHLYQPIQYTGRKRPDLFGFDRNMELLIMEAKGRSNGIEAGLIQKAKGQTTALQDVQGIAPSLTVDGRVFELLAAARRKWAP